MKRFILPSLFLLSLSGCFAPEIPPIPVSVNLEQSFQGVTAGQHRFTLQFPTASHPGFELKDESGRSFLSIAEKDLELRDDFSTEKREGYTTIHGLATSAGESIEVTGKLTISNQWVTLPREPSGHVPNTDGMEYDFDGRMSLSGQTLGTLSGKHFVAE